MLATLSIFAQNWKQPRCSKRLKKTLVISYNGIIFSNKKKWTIKQQKKTWRNLKFILLRKKIQSVKATYYMTMTKWLYGKGNTLIETVKRSMVIKCSRNAEEMTGGTYDILETWNYPVYYTDEYMKLCICHHPYNCTKDWALT